MKSSIPLAGLSGVAVVAALAVAPFGGRALGSATHWQFYGGSAGGDGLSSANWTSDVTKATHHQRAAPA